jgi:geranylgeranyl diphosphate synthase, type III
MERTGSFKYCRKVLGELVEKAGNLVEEMDEGKGEGAGVLAILDMMKVN